MTAPTVGLAVHFQPIQFPMDPAPPMLAATITSIHESTSVDLEIVAGNGAAYAQMNVQLLQVGDPVPTPIEPDGHVPFFARMTS